MPEQKSKNIIIVSVIVVVVILLFVTAFILFLNNRDTVSMIDVSKQRPSETITIIETALYKDGFVALHDYTDDVIGPVVGTSEYLEDGLHKKVRITLTVPPQRDMKLVAMLYKDNGDGIFNQGTDKRVKDIEGAIVMKDFELKF